MGSGAGGQQRRFMRYRRHRVLGWRGVRGIGGCQLPVRDDLYRVIPVNPKSSRSEAARLVNPRRAVRHAAMNLACELGSIVDLSETGLRILCVGRPKVEVGSMVRLSVASPMQKLTVSGQVMWVKRPLLKAGQVGVKFVNTSEGVARALVELAEHGFVDTSKVAEQWTRGTSAKGDAGGGAGVRATVEMEDYYGALGVLPSATDKEVHTAFRALARQLHPDVNPSEDANARFAYVAKAYATLRDPVKRLKYDAARRGRAA